MSNISNPPDVQYKVVENQGRKEELIAQVGKLGTIFGSGENAKTNYLGAIALGLILFLALYVRENGFSNSKDLITFLLTPITTIIGYLAGKK